jgi:hypothetical protein
LPPAAPSSRLSSRGKRSSRCSFTHRWQDTTGKQVQKLTSVLNADENRAEAADLLRALIDRIELTPNAEGKLDIDLYGDLAGILGLAAKRNGPLDPSDPFLQQVKVVAVTRNHRQFPIEIAI